MSAALTSRTSLPMSVPRCPAKPRTLVVDDSPTILHAICSLLEHREVVDVVGRAESGPETISAVAELKPDLVLIDADMPGMSGLRTSLLLTQDAPAARIVLMSMDTTPQFQRACAGCGAFAVIYKPKFLSELVKLLQAESATDWENPASRPRRKLRRPATIMR
jgi:DNA-binding NarL/FixJ family response regulator